jgi:hypothetical protein
MIAPLKLKVLLKLGAAALAAGEDEFDEPG